MADTHRGCVAIITGAGRGLGRTMALGLLQAGAQVTGVDIDPPALDELNGAAGAARQRLLPLKADVTREDEARGIVAQTMERFGRVDVLVNNAGLNLSTVDPSAIKTAPSFRDIAPADYRRIFEVNAIAPFLVARAAIEPMLKQKWGRIIGVTTSLDTMYRKGMMPYGATKAAHECFVAALADELEGSGITANVLVPGGAAITRMTAGYGAAQAKMIPPERHGEAAAVASLARVRRREWTALHRCAVGRQARARGRGREMQRARRLAAIGSAVDPARFGALARLRRQLDIDLEHRGVAVTAELHIDRVVLRRHVFPHDRDEIVAQRRQEIRAVAADALVREDEHQPFLGDRSRPRTLRQKKIEQPHHALPNKARKMLRRSSLSKRSSRCSPKKRATASS